ncbi:MAG TPA: type II toxin-antitoxin system RelE/ParE family toxin [Thermoanaerobaculia bacterium]|nr:type II toxin-antitoxin system RelE/ParE family toxin [Thermoanaerobaculia bacterium]
MPRIIVLDDAEDELVAAEDWYEDQRAGLGVEFRAEVEAVVQGIASGTDVSRPVLDVTGVTGARKVAVRRFPYSVVFLPQGSTVWILAFAHHRRRPGYWRGRVLPR